MSVYITIVITLLFSAFFSGMEIAFVSSNKLRFEIEKKKQRVTSSILSVFYRNQEQYITTLLVGNNIVLVVYSLKMAELLRPYLLWIGSDAVVTIVQTVAATIIVLFTGEFLPKTIFKNRPNLWLRVFAIPLFFFYVLLFPIAKACTWISIVILRLFRLDKGNNSSERALSRMDLDYLLQENLEVQEKNKEVDQDVKILQNALDFSSVKLRDCIVPRTELTALELDATTLDELKSVFVETGYSKILIYKKSIDNIVGYIHSSEMFKHQADWKSAIRKMPIVPEIMAANKLMKLFMQEKKNIAVVVDEFGGTAGIVTLEDIIEEIFGEIEDEHDNREYVSKQLSDNEYILSGRLEIEVVNGQYHLEIPESDNYQTVAGYILSEYQDFPQMNENIQIGRYHFKIIKAHRNLIELVKLTVS